VPLITAPGMVDRAYFLTCSSSRACAFPHLTETQLRVPTDCGWLNLKPTVEAAEWRAWQAAVRFQPHPLPRLRRLRAAAFTSAPSPHQSVECCRCGDASRPWKRIPPHDWQSALGGAGLQWATAPLLRPPRVLAIGPRGKTLGWRGAALATGPTPRGMPPAPLQPPPRLPPPRACFLWILLWLGFSLSA
jgi:hypothetical protein